jgi:N-acetyl-gamma-glutamylphosphate reductase
MNSYSSPVRVALVGATGYAGQELVGLLARHPQARLEAAMS